MALEIPIGTSAKAVPTQPASPDVELTATGRFAVWASIISVLFLSQIAYNIGTFAVSTDLVCYLIVALYLVWSGHATIKPASFALFIIALALACFGTLAAKSTASWTSLLLLFALYAPFFIRLRSRPVAVHEYIVNAFISASIVLAVVAIVQLVLVNALHLKVLTNIYFILPEAIRGAGTYTFFREGGGLTKANGFFLRESADLSVLVALALIVEYTSRARMRTMAILAVGLLSSLSGSGLLAITAGMLMPKSLVRIPLFFVSLVGFVLALYLLYSLEIPGLDIWFGRLSEFQTPNTSAYARFVAPMEMVQHSFDDGVVTTWLGNGAGTYLRDIGQLKVKYEINDPTWAKLTYEYGLIGLGLFTAILLQRLFSSSLRVEVSNYLLFSWITIGLVLKPSFALIAWILTLVAQQPRPSSPPAQNVRQGQSAPA